MPLAAGSKLGAMLSFGDKLKREREMRNTSLEDLAGATGIGVSYLRALEHNEFEALPGRAFGKLYIRAYAEVFGFDPRPLIADYDRERIDRERIVPPEAWYANPILVPPTAAGPAPREDADADEDEGPAEVPPGEPPPAIEARPVEAPPERAAPEQALVEASAGPWVEPRAIWPREATSEEPARPWRARARWWAAAAVVVLVVVVAGIPVLLRGDRLEAEPPAATVAPEKSAVPVEAPPQATPPETPVVRSEAAAAGDANAGANPPVSKVEPTGASSGLAVSEFGVGRDRRLGARDDRFAEGEVVWFSTRLVGGRRGDRVRHVWLRDGRQVQAIALAVGGSSWRTQSNKTLWGAGEWAVEARDDQGRVLARATFTCTPRAR